MKALTTALFLCIAVRAAGETRIMAAATPEGMIGVWEALIPDGGSMASGVYQMVISPQGDATLIEVYALRGGGASSGFFGSAKSIQLHDGKFTVRFSVHPDQQQRCDWIEIQGSASVDGDLGAISGKMIKHTVDSDAPFSEPVRFRKGHWFSELAAVAAAAERIIHSPRFINGGAVPEERDESQ